MNVNEQKLQELLDRILDRTCTDAQLEEFAKLIDDNADFSTALVAQLRMNSLLRWHCGETKRFVALDSQTQPMQNGVENVATRLLQFANTRWKWVAAAVVLIAASIASSQRWQRADIHPAPLADIVEDDHVKWAETTSAVQDGGRVSAGRLEMTSGNLTLRFRSGATLWARGPVSMRVESDMLVRLDKGQATAKVPQWAKGFTIKTLNVEVVDQGTKFGVMARDGGATDVVVFEGQVDLRSIALPETPEKRLNQGEGVRVSNQGAIDRIVEVRRDSAGGRWTTDLPGWSETTFKSIRDSIPSVDCPTYYQITSHGLEDDCRAYTDCTHEWNGLTSEGLPDFLLHADYVMMRNDYRYLNKFGMVVELARPAVVYVFWDHRVPTPKWLTEQFENAGVDIGLDEGPWKEGDTRHSVAVGGGQSIDTVFSVWRRRCESPETLKLGSMGTTPGARAMYGVAAKPLD